METKGVSRQVSVEIGDVDHWAENVATRGREENLRQVEMIPQAGGGRISEVRVRGGSVTDTSVHPAPFDERIGDLIPARRVRSTRDPHRRKSA